MTFLITACLNITICIITKKKQNYSMNQHSSLNSTHETLSGMRHFLPPAIFNYVHFTTESPHKYAEVEKLCLQHTICRKYFKIENPNRLTIEKLIIHHAARQKLFSDHHQYRHIKKNNYEKSPIIIGKIKTATRFLLPDCFYRLSRRLRVNLMLHFLLINFCCF